MLTEAVMVAPALAALAAEGFTEAILLITDDVILAHVTGPELGASLSQRPVWQVAQIIQHFGQMQITIGFHSRI